MEDWTMTDKLKMHSMNKVDENIEKIGKLFPNCITERKNEKGEVEYAVDFDMLKQELSAVVVEGNEERYQFTWPDKKKSILLANAPIAKTLRPCREESVDFDDTENLYIEGDNLDVLKLLQETYLGKIKMIYIDPPYNTGKDFVYADNFTQNTSEYILTSGQLDEAGNRLVTNTEGNGRFHTDWLNMIYPRLKLAKDLLSDDGVVFISIDDNEVENLKKICDEIFGAINHLVALIWNKQHSQQQGIFKRYHETVLVYAKNASNIGNIMCGEGIIEAGAMKKISKANPESEFKFPAGTRFDAPDGTEFSGTFGDAEKVTVVSGRMIAKDGKLLEDVTLSAGWTQKNQMRDYFDGKEVIDSKGQMVTEFYFNSTGKIKCTKIRESITPPSILPMYGTVSEQSKKLAELLNGYYFDTPKPVNMIMDFCKWFSSNDDIVLDFFSGSATTAHSIMQLNAEDGGNRKFIMVQLPEETDEKSEAHKAGYKNICEIGKERIRRAGAKIKEDLKDRVVTKNGVTAVRRPKPENSIYEDNSVDIMDDPILIKTVDEWRTSRPEDEYNQLLKNLDTGFRVLKLDSTNMKDVYYNPAEYELSLFDTLANNIKEDRTPEDLLFQVMLDLGILISSKIEESTISGKKVFNVADGFLYACFDENVTEDVITEIAKKNPYYFVMRDSSMANDSVATNFEQIFATYSPDTERKVL